MKPNRRVMHSGNAGVVTTCVTLAHALISLQARLTDLFGAAPWELAIGKFGPGTKAIAMWLTNPVRSARCRIETCLCQYDMNGAIRNAICHVYAFAVLCRFEEYLEQAREEFGFERTFVNGAAIDLLQELVDCWHHQDEERMIKLIANEAKHYLEPNADLLALRECVQAYLPEFEQLARETYYAPGAIESAKQLID